MKEKNFTGLSERISLSTREIYETYQTLVWFYSKDMKAFKTLAFLYKVFLKLEGFICERSLSS
jgi:hypothetical protein